MKKENPNSIFMNILGPNLMVFLNHYLNGITKQDKLLKNITV